MSQMEIYGSAFPTSTAEITGEALRPGCGWDYSLKIGNLTINLTEAQAGRIVSQLDIAIMDRHHKELAAKHDEDMELAAKHDEFIRHHDENEMDIMDSHNTDFVKSFDRKERP